MKHFLTLLLMLFAGLFVLACVEKTSETIRISQNESLAAENDSLKKVIDSLRRPEAFTTDTLARNAANPSGKNPITLHWISWTEQGEATLDYMHDGSYQISGSQANDAREYLNIMGVIRRISDTELEFTGTVETRTNINYDGKPCIKNGRQIFKRSGNRKYYRMQNMENCMGQHVVDYIDIYPGSSGLLRL